MTLAALAVPQAMGYAKIAGMPVVAGLGLLLAWIARLGFLANFLSRTVLVGFLAGLGIQVAAYQVPT